MRWGRTAVETAPTSARETGLAAWAMELHTANTRSCISCGTSVWNRPLEQTFTTEMATPMAANAATATQRLRLPDGRQQQPDHRNPPHHSQAPPQPGAYGRDDERARQRARGKARHQQAKAAGVGAQAVLRHER